MGVTVSAPRAYEIYDGHGWVGRQTLNTEQVQSKRAVGYRVVERATGDGEEQPEVELTAAAIQKSLDEPITVPHECICAFIRISPYGLVQRHSNPACTEHSPGEPDGELEKERDR